MTSSEEGKTQHGRERKPLPGLEILEPEGLLDDVFDEDGRTVLITGSAGNIGRKLASAWAGRYDLAGLDLATGNDDLTSEWDLSEWSEDLISLLESVDVVVHLAGNPNSRAQWPDLVRPNVDAVSNILNAAGLAGVSRVIFASSNHAMGAYRDLEGEIHEDLPPLPDGPYGASKLVGERLGRAAALQYQMEFIAIRIGWVQEGENRPETLPDAWSRGLWLSNGDLVRLFTAAVEAELPDTNVVVVNGMSANRGSRWSLRHANATLGYQPADDAG